jgi:hypothetical protein
MPMNVGQVYRCQNSRCRSEVKVVRHSSVARKNPRCSCGAEMKKAYVPPVLRVLPQEVKVLAVGSAHGN